MLYEVITGAEAADNKTGDGAGILMQIPHDFILSEGIKVPAPGQYGTGLMFLPQNAQEAEKCIEIFNNAIQEEGLEVIGYRNNFV